MSTKKKKREKSASRADADQTQTEGFSEEERRAMKERADEVKAARRGSRRSSKGDGERDLLARLAEMPDADRTLGERLHALIRASAPDLSPRLWYGMPAYANEEGKVVCFFQAASKFNTRYATLGFSDTASLDDGAMWPTAFALKEMTDAEASQIEALVKKAVR